MNKVQILGTMTRDAEVRYTQSGTAIASFGIAYNEKRKSADGNYNDVSHFFDVTAFGRQAEVINQHFKKGSRILIDGSLDFQSWEKDGQKHSKVSIKLNGFDFIDRKQSNDYQDHNNKYDEPSRNQSEYQSSSIPEIDIASDEIPF